MANIKTEEQEEIKIKQDDQDQQRPVQEEEEQIEETEEGQKEKDLRKFPLRLMDILNDESNSEAIAWLPKGQGFIILKKDKFTSEVLPRYFDHCKYASFTRNLNRWGFKRVTRDTSTAGSYFHKMFRRDEPWLCNEMKSTVPRHSCERNFKHTTTSSPLVGSAMLYDTPSSRLGGSLSTTTMLEQQLQQNRMMIVQRRLQLQRLSMMQNNNKHNQYQQNLRTLASTNPFLQLGSSLRSLPPLASSSAALRQQLNLHQITQPRSVPSSSGLMGGVSWRATSA